MIATFNLSVASSTIFLGQFFVLFTMKLNEFRLSFGFGCHYDEPESIVLFGRSLGSGPVCRLAMRLQAQGEKIGGVILHSPFVSVREAGISLLVRYRGRASDLIPYK